MLSYNRGLLEQFVEHSKKKTWKHWGLAVIVNLGAAVVAVLAFDAWQRFQSPQSAANLLHRGGVSYELVDDVGYVPGANTRMAAHSEVEGRTIFDVVYTTGPDHFRGIRTGRAAGWAPMDDRCGMAASAIPIATTGGDGSA